MDRFRLNPEETIAREIHSYMLYKYNRMQSQDTEYIQREMIIYKLDAILKNLEALLQRENQNST
jgi:hypothetical protein